MTLRSNDCGDDAAQLHRVAGHDEPQHFPIPKILLALGSSKSVAVDGQEVEDGEPTSAGKDASEVEGAHWSGVHSNARWEHADGDDRNGGDDEDGDEDGDGDVHDDAVGA